MYKTVLTACLDCAIGDEKNKKKFTSRGAWEMHPKLDVNVLLVALLSPCDGRPWAKV
jgi:hypothetical protein